MDHLLLKNPFTLVLALLPFLPSSWGYNNPTKLMTYHKGPVLTGNINLAIVWYGRINPVEKERILTFIASLNHNGLRDLKPSVSKWWRVVESYQSTVLGAAHSRNSRINVRVVGQIHDALYSSGPYLDTRRIRRLMYQATRGAPNVIPVIFTSKDVRVDGACSSTCYLHGVRRNTKSIYLIIANPEWECPEKCTWPYHKGTKALRGFTLKPQSGDIGADTMLIHFASGLVSVITDPLQTGFVKGDNKHPIEVSSACESVFGSRAFPGFPGRVRVDPSTGGAFNALGINGSKFLLPALWNPFSSSCWTLM